jgi:hypothetical protein
MFAQVDKSSRMAELRRHLLCEEYAIEMSILS